MAYHRSAHRSADGCDDLERRVQAAGELVRETVLLLCRSRPPGSLAVAAHDALKGLQPEVRGALVALEGIERLRPLTDEELAWRRALTMLLCTEERPSPTWTTGRYPA
jgi:hypothetical protein